MTGKVVPLPDRRGRYPILTVKATFAPVDCPLLGEQFDIITESLRPISADRDWPLYGDEYGRMKFGNYQKRTFDLHSLQ